MPRIKNLPLEFGLLFVFEILLKLFDSLGSFCLFHAVLPLFRLHAFREM